MHFFQPKSVPYSLLGITSVWVFEKRVTVHRGTIASEKAAPTTKIVMTKICTEDLRKCYLLSAQLFVGTGLALVKSLSI